ncbi:MAG: gluconate 2-dehydrogenase subunit 3 family protein [Bryobacteraceae bacterium]
MTRRDAGWMILRAAAAAGGSEFLTAWIEAAPVAGQRNRPPENQFAPPEPDRWKDYRPHFFSPEEFQILDVYTALLIPADETPGAREAHVAPFIDFVVNAAAEYAPDMQKKWRRAVAWLHAQNFAALSEDRQLALMRAMSEPEHDRGKTHDGFFAYRLIKDMTIHAFYTSREGLIGDLDYQGMAYLNAFPGCTHPEHHRV